MTNKYTIESPEIKGHQNYYIFSYCNQEVADLMNQAYQEGIEFGMRQHTILDKQCMMHILEDLNNDR